MQQIILKQHYGLGDYIICNALVRNFAKSYKVILPVAQQYIESVTFMYRDNSNIECVVHENFNYNTDIEIKTIGFDWSHHPSTYPNENFEEMFYKHASLDFNKKWDDFFVERDLHREQTFFNKLNLFPNEYAFVHEYQQPTNVLIDRSLIETKKIFSVNENILTNNIFDYCTLIENAKEVHVIGSSFICLIDICKGLNLPKKLFFHRYSKFSIRNNNWMQPKLKNSWHIFP